jgi:hypothetical protein
VSFFQAGEAPFDRWSLVHVGSGIALGLVFADWTGFLIVVALLVGYEALEGILRHIKPDPNGKGLFEYESWPNIIADVLVGLAGFVAIRLAFRLL